MSSPIILVSGEGHKIEMDCHLCTYSGLVQEMLSSLGLSSTTDQPIEVPLGSFVKTSTVEKIKKYLLLLDANKSTNVDKIKVPNAQGTGNIEIEKPAYMMQEWEVNFSDTLDEDELYDLMMAANYMDIQNLLEMTTSVVANMIRGRPADELREILGVECDFTPDELEEIHRQNVWLAD